MVDFSKYNYSLCFVMTFALSTAAHAQTAPEPSQDISQYRAITQRIHDVDATGQLFSYSIAAVGGGAALGLSSWLLYAQPGEKDGAPSPLILSSAILMAGSGLGQFLHGGMRMGERQSSARAAKLLLDNPNTTDQQFLDFLRYRADLSANTRFMGGLLTTVQAASALGAGLEMALNTGGDYGTAGWVITGVGILGTGVGVIHFFGKTRSQRELGKLQE
tara:strand:- start:810 stop:1463 length:654 start_codon:yes stop_codon:yes gene_type:complete